MNNVHRLFRGRFLALVVGSVLGIGAAQAQMTIGNPNWEIWLTDAGYSDYLGDLTPGFQGREYLSGEWGAALGYRIGQTTVAPKWLEPNFIFPDWSTNSNFSTLSGLGGIATNNAGLPIAAASVSNGTLRVDQRIEMVDTLTGIAIGTSAASLGGNGSFILSDRYVMKQSYTIVNVSEQTVGDLQLFQLLHGLNSESGVYDSRIYAGALSSYRYGVTLKGRDLGSGAGQFDYITFKSAVAPSAFEIGAYGTASIDSHSIGKPSAGVHLSVESNWTGADAANNGRDAFAATASGEPWIAGGQRWNLGALAPNQSATLDVLLGIRTGWVVSGGDGVSGSSGGGSSVPGGVDFSFESIDQNGGTVFSSFLLANVEEIAELMREGEFGALRFFAPGGRLQLFDIEFEGSFSGQVRLTLGYDPSVLPEGFDSHNLRVYHWVDGEWQDLGGEVDVLAHTITFYADSFSPFAVAAAVPEPAQYATMLVGLLLLGASGRRRVGARQIAMSRELRSVRRESAVRRGL